MKQPFKRLFTASWKPAEGETGRVSGDLAAIEGTIEHYAGDLSRLRPEFYERVITDLSDSISSKYLEALLERSEQY